jgi:hypothetical protein
MISVKLRMYFWLLHSFRGHRHIDLGIWGCFVGNLGYWGYWGCFGGTLGVFWGYWGCFGGTLGFLGVLGILAHTNRYKQPLFKRL